MSDGRSTLKEQSDRLSFKVRRPSPLSRQSSNGPDSEAGTPSFRIPPPPNKSLNLPPTYKGDSSKRRFAGQTFHHNNSDSDEEDETADELITGFDELGVQRSKPKPKPQGPLVIPALPNRDWRAEVRARKGATGYIPEGGRASVMIGVDGSQGGLGTKDTINSGPQLVGLISKTRPKESAVDEKAIEEPAEDIHMEEDQPQPEKSLDQIALEAVLRGGDAEDSKLQVDIIPMVKPSAMDEATAYRFDVATRPDEATLEDYTRVPVEQFGAALLRGMGWKEGAATTKNGKTAVQPYLPQQRPSLLGLGAKEKAVDNDSQPGRSNSSRNQSSRRGEPQKYIPLLKQETSGRPSSGNGSRRNSRSRSPTYRDSRDSRDGSRRPSRSPSPSSRRDRDRDRDRDRYSDGDYRRRRREGDLESSRKDRDRHREYHGSDRDSNKRRHQDRDYDRDRR